MTGELLDIDDTGVTSQLDEGAQADLGE